MKNIFAKVNFQNRVNAKADQFGLAGIDRQVFCCLADNGLQIQTLWKMLGNQDAGEVVMALARLMKSGVVYSVAGGSRYITVAID